MAARAGVWMLPMALLVAAAAGATTRTVDITQDLDDASLQRGRLFAARRPHGCGGRRRHRLRAPGLPALDDPGGQRLQRSAPDRQRGPDQRTGIRRPDRLRRLRQRRHRRRPRLRRRGRFPRRPPDLPLRDDRPPRAGDQHRLPRRRLPDQPDLPPDIGSALRELPRLGRRPPASPATSAAEKGAPSTTPRAGGSRSISRPSTPTSPVKAISVRAASSASRAAAAARSPPPAT